MADRVAAEARLLRDVWPDLTYVETGQWVLLPEYRLPEGWSAASTGVAFQIPAGPAGTPPYAFYVDRPLTHAGRQPENYTPNASGPPFPGGWSVFSWAPEGWAWAEDPAMGANMVSFARSFAARFAEGA